MLTSVNYSPETNAGKPQFSADWKNTPQIKFNIIWGWDCFVDGGAKANAEDNFSHGHDMEFMWLLLEAQRILKAGNEPYEKLFKSILDHVLNYGIDHEYGGVYVEAIK